MTRSRCVLMACGAFALSLTFFSMSASAQTSCGPNTRQQYQQDVANGMLPGDLETKYGHCRDFQGPSCISTNSPELDLKTKTGGIFNNFYEQTNGCGYHPQNEIVGCDVEIKQTFGFGPFGAAPLGSTEFVRFCLDCDANPNTWEFTTVGTVHATDNNFATNPAPTPSWYHLVTASTAAAPAICIANNGGQGRMRTILSWAFMPPPAACNGNFAGIIWGNWMDVTIRRDP